MGRIDADALVAKQPEMLVVATACNPLQLTDWVRHTLATHGAHALEAAEQRGQDRRMWQHSRDADGTLRGRFVISGEDSEVVLVVMEAIARRQGNDDFRSAAQRRADAFVDVFGQVARHGDLPDSGGQRPQLSYVLPADWAAADACTACGPRCLDHQPISFADTLDAHTAGADGTRADGASSGG